MPLLCKVVSLFSEVLDFLSSEECQQFIEAGRQLGLETSGLFGADINEDLSRTDNSEITRISDQTWLRPTNLPGLWESLMKRFVTVHKHCVGPNVTVC